MKKELLIVATLLAVVSSHVYADQSSERRGPPPSFDEMDANGDGVLSRDEVKGPLLEDFDRLDVNGDGVLSEDELPEPPQKGERPN